MPPICPYCDEPSIFVDSSEVYSKSYGMIYLCRPCQAWVGVHQGTTTPLGRLANAVLRRAKQAAHAVFDPLWKNKMKQGFTKSAARGKGYKWLAEQLQIEAKDCHIGMFDVEQCQKVIDICTPPYGAKDV